MLIFAGGVTTALALALAALVATLVAALVAALVAVLAFATPAPTSGILTSMISLPSRSNPSGVPFGGSASPSKMNLHCDKATLFFSANLVMTYWNCPFIRIDNVVTSLVLP